MTGTCELCERENVETTRHHLIPVARHKNKKTKKETTYHERHTVAHICRSCHSQLHALFTEKELERVFNTIEKLKAHSDVQVFIAWIKTKSWGKNC